MKLLLIILFCSLVSAQPNKIIFNTSSSLVTSLDYDNHFIDFFYSGRNIYQNDGVSTPLRHSGFLDWEFRLPSEIDTIDAFYIDSTFIDSTYHDAFIIKYTGDGAFPKFEDFITGVHYMFAFDGESFSTDAEESKAVIGFWIKRDSLNGNGLIFRNIQGGTYTLTGSNLSLQGYEDNRWEVFRVVGDYSYLKFKLYNSIYSGLPYFRLSIYPSSVNEVTQITIYNPSLVYSKSIDPYKRYNSPSEKDTSITRAQKLLYVGDSQYNDGYFHTTLAEYTGLEIHDHHYGGYRMAYSATSWFYQDTIKNKAFAIDDVDFYFFPISSNDNAGGDTTEASIDSVIYYYPFYGDHADTVTAKLARFNTLSEGRKASIFQFQQTYCAYIEQIKLVNPTARIIIGSVPIGAGSGTMTRTVSMSRPTT